MKKKSMVVLKSESRYIYQLIEEFGGPFIALKRLLIFTKIRFCEFHKF